MVTEMKRVTIRGAGSYDRLEFERLSVPAPGPDEVVVETRAIGVNYADVIVRMGLYASAKELVGWPITPGFEVAGTVTAVGESVDDLSVGDEVVAITLFFGYSTHVVTPRAFVFSKPSGFSFAEAAAMPTIFATAWYALCELAHPRPDAKMLVHSAAGGVGGALVQVGKHLGCEIVGVVGGTHKVKTAKAHGCDLVIDKSTEDLWSVAERFAPEGYDVVCDANGVATLKQSYEHLRRTGKLVVYGFATMMPKEGGKPNWLKLAAGWLRTPRFNPLDLTQSSKSVLAFNLSYLFDRVDILEAFMRDFSQWVEAGVIQPPPITEYPLDDVARAHADIESGTTVGKLILVP